MRRWEDSLKQKAHNSTVRNARSTVNPKRANNANNTSSNSRTPNNTKSRNAADSSQTSSLSGYYEHEKDDLTQIPLYRLLKMYNLQ
jgi:hypothetical protein